MPETLSQTLSEALEELTSWVQQVQKAEEDAQKVIAPLFHYTSASGLKGILESRQLWFTSVFHLNDPSELTSGLETAVDLLNELRDKGGKDRKEVCDTMEKVVTHDLGFHFGFFVASFSRNGNELGQWRAYGDNGRGFAIGLAPALFQPEERRVGSNPNEKFFCSPVIYDEAISRKTHRDVIERALGIVDRMSSAGELNNSGQRAHFLRELSIAIASRVLWNSITTKHNAYALEQETRLLMVNGIDILKPYIETRIRGSELVPFIRAPMEIEQGNITKIVVGPAADENAEDAVGHLLRRQGIRPDGIVVRSDIPYRPV